MGCQRGTRSAFTRAFWAKRELHWGKRRSLLYIQHGAHNDLSFPLDYNLFLGKLDEKLAQDLQFLYANPLMFCVQCRIPLVFRYLYRYS